MQFREYLTTVDEAKNNEILGIFQAGNDKIDAELEAAGVSKANIKKAKAWRPPAKMPKDMEKISKVLQRIMKDY